MTGQSTAGAGEMPTHYEVLEVASSASERIIRLAYRELARQHHPDQGGSDHDMTRVAKAYEVLSDPVRRAAYDKTLNETPNARAATNTGEHVPDDDVVVEEFEDDWGEDQVETPPSEPSQEAWSSEPYGEPPVRAPTAPSGHAFPWEGAPHTRPANFAPAVPPMPTMDAAQRRLGVLRVTGTGSTVWVARISSWVLFVLLVGSFVLAAVIYLAQGRVGDAVSGLGWGATLGALAYFGASIRATGGRVSKRYVLYLLLCVLGSTVGSSGSRAVAVVWTVAYVLAVESRNRLARRPG